MCIVVDINTLAPVFNETCDRHREFVHVKNWIESGKGILVYGGTKFKEELHATYRYLRLIRQMKDSGKAIAIQDNEVDAAEKKIKEQTKNTDCDDQHIIALLRVSRCPLLCSEDARSYKYIQNRTFYPKGSPKVRIYSSSKNQTLLKPLCRDLLRNTV